MAQGDVTSDGNTTLACSVTYALDDGSKIQFAFEKMTYMACWAVWDGAGRDISAPVHTSWVQHLIAPWPANALAGIELLVYTVTYGAPVPQGVICPGQ